MIAASSYSIVTFLTFKALCHVRTGGNGFCTAGSPPWHHAQAHRAVLLAGDRFCTFAIDLGGSGGSDRCGSCRHGGGSGGGGCRCGGRNWAIGVEGAHNIVQGTGHRLTGGNVARYGQHVSKIAVGLAGNFGNNGSTGNFLVYGIGCSVAIIGNLIPYIDNVSPFVPLCTVLRHPAVACSSDAGSRQEWVQNTGCFGTIAIRTVNDWNAVQVDR